MFTALCFRGYGKIKEEGLLLDWGAQRCLGPHFVLPQSLYFPGTGAPTAHPRNPALHPESPRMNLPAGHESRGSAGLMPPTRLVGSLGTFCAWLRCCGCAFGHSSVSVLVSLLKVHNPSVGVSTDSTGFASFGLIGCFLGMLAVWLVNLFGGFEMQKKSNVE